MAGLQLGIYQSLEEIAEMWRSEKRFASKMAESDRERRYHGWKKAVERVRS